MQIIPAREQKGQGPSEGVFFWDSFDMIGRTFFYFIEIRQVEQLQVKMYSNNQLLAIDMVNIPVELLNSNSNYLKN